VSVLEGASLSLREKGRAVPINCAME